MGMWKKLIGDYFIKFKRNNANQYEIACTNFVQLWTINLSVQQILQCAKDSNSDLDIEDTELLQNLKNFFNDDASFNKIDVTLLPDYILIKIIKNVVPGFPLRLNLKLIEGPHEMFFRQVTAPLLETIAELKTSQDELCKLLIQKDREINEYKEEGGQLYLKHLKTPQFNHDAYNAKYTKLTNLFTNGALPDSVLQKLQDYKRDSNTIKLENVKQEVKEEPSVSLTRMKRESTAVQSQTEPSESGDSASVTVKEEIKTETQSSASNKKRKKLFNL